MKYSSSTTTSLGIQSPFFPWYFELPAFQVGGPIPLKLLIIALQRRILIEYCSKNPRNSLNFMAHATSFFCPQATFLSKKHSNIVNYEKGILRVVTF